MPTTITRLPARVLVPLGTLENDDWFDHEDVLYRIYCIVPDEETGEIKVFAFHDGSFSEDSLSPDTEVEPMDVLFVVRPKAATPN